MLRMLQHSGPQFRGQKLVGVDFLCVLYITETRKPYNCSFERQIH